MSKNWRKYYDKEKRKVFRHDACERCGVSFVSANKIASFCSTKCSAIVRCERQMALRHITFWDKVDVKGCQDCCWPWFGYINPANGYGQVGVNRKLKLVHRVALEFSTGIAVPDDMEVCHACDNPPCCNPNHLWIGTHKDNMQDMVSKDRQRNGANSRAKNGN